MANRQQIEKEYLDAKERLAAAECAGAEWDQRAGIASLREQVESADSAERRAAMRLARTKPTTPAGGGATSIIQHVRRGGRGSPWIVDLLKRKPPKLAAVAVANKMARSAWKLMITGESYVAKSTLATLASA